MSAPKVRSDFDGLSQVAKQFSQQAEATRNTTSNLKQKMDVLRGKDWVGKGATKFYNEMDSSLMPTLKRLSTALDSAGRTTLKIRDIMKRAEDDASALFKGGLDGSGASAGGAGAGAGATTGGAAGGTSGGSSGGSSGGASGGTSGGGSSSGSGNPLLARDPNSLFKDDYMKSLIGSKFQGADSRALNNAMEALAKNPKGAELDAALNKIAELRGRPVNEIKAEYQKFLQARPGPRSPPACGTRCARWCA